MRTMKKAIASAMNSSMPCNRRTPPKPTTSASPSHGSARRSRLMSERTYSQPEWTVKVMADWRSWWRAANVGRHGRRRVSEATRVGRRGEEGAHAPPTDRPKHSARPFINDHLDRGYQE